LRELRVALGELCEVSGGDSIGDNMQTIVRSGPR
jgi:hypothetical protein